MLGPVQFPMKVRSSLLIPIKKKKKKKPHWDPQRDCTESVDQYWQYCHLSTIKSSDP